MKIKICGITRAEEAEYLNDNRVDMAGFVLFYSKSKRNIEIEETLSIRRKLDRSIKSVAVTVSPTVEQACLIIEAGFDMLQIHGNIPDGYFDLSGKIPVIKAFNVKDIESYPEYVGNKDIAGFVFDADEPGSGKTFDWEMLSLLERDKEKIFILSGGLNELNVGKAIESVKPDMVDISSGVEYAGDEFRGKDPARIRAFVEAVRRADLL